MPEYRLVRHRGNFSLAFTDEQRGRIRVALGTDDRGVAESRARDIWRSRSIPQSERIADLWATYAADRKANVARADRFDDIWKPLAPHFGHRLGMAITRQDCRAYHKARQREGKSASTIRTELEFLRACLRWHYKSAAPAIWLPAESAPRNRYLTKAEANALLAHIETPHVRLFVVLALATGARMTALLELTWDRVDMERGTADLNPAGRHKTNKRRTVVTLNERAMEALRAARQAAMTDYVIEYAQGPLKSVKKAIGSAARRSGIPISAHVLRHSAAVWAAEAGRPMAEIAQFLGHTSTKMTERVYARFSPDYLRGVADALEF
jgi:integrase